MNTKLTQLKERGFKIKITHYRPFKTNIKRTNKDNLIIYLPKYHKRAGNLQLMSRGGWTTLQIFKDNKLVEETLAICNNLDNYDYKIAVAQATNQLISPELT
jgi:hypothetical protein